MTADLARLAKHSATLNMEGDDAGGTTDMLERGADATARRVFQILLRANPDIKGHGALPGDTNVSAGLSPTSLSVFKDVPGGIVAGLLKFFTREPPPGITYGGPVSLESLGELSPADTPGMERGQELVV